MPNLDNPFPGMNPYLEDPRFWQGIHLRLIAAIDSELSAALPAEYLSSIEERVYIVGWEEYYRPDNAVMQRAPDQFPASRSGAKGQTAVMEREAATTFDEPITLEWIPETVHEPFIAIRTLNDAEELIAAIEVLSPTNKQDGLGWDSYKNKQTTLYNSPVHFLEIDLLRAGRRTLPPDGAAGKRLALFDYFVSLHKGGKGESIDLWPILLQNRLPHIQLPLAGEDFVPLDIQNVVNRACSDGGAARRLLRAYSSPPNPPRSPENEAWANALLRKRGLREQTQSLTSG